MATKKTTTKSTDNVTAADLTQVQVQSDRAVKQLESQKRTLALKYKDEPKVPVSLSPMYAPYLGKVHRIAVNGISVYVPCDGRSYDIPKTFAAELNRKRRAIDDILTKQSAIADVSNNLEQNIGELSY